MKARARTLAQFTAFLWGPIIWAVHFAFVYISTSLETTFRPYAGLPSRLAIAVVTLGLLWSLWPAYKHPDRWAPGEEGSDVRRFWMSAMRVQCVIAAVSLVWQALPALLVP